MVGRKGTCSAGDREGPFIAFHPLSINQAPDVKPFLGLGFGNVEGKTTVARCGEGAREDGRNLRQTLRMRPVFIHHVVLEPHHYSGPRHIPVINTEGSRKDRAARMRKRGIFRGSPEEP